MDIEPRGTVYDWYGGKAWTRVINGRVHHMHIAALHPYWADYWGATVEITHYSHPYGKLFERTPSRKVRI